MKQIKSTQKINKTEYTFMSEGGTLQVPQHIY